MAAMVRVERVPVLKGGLVSQPEREPITHTRLFRSLLPMCSPWLAGNGTSVHPQEEDINQEGAASG